MKDHQIAQLSSAIKNELNKVYAHKLPQSLRGVISNVIVLELEKMGLREDLPCKIKKTY